MDITSQLLEAAVDIARDRSLRAYDAIQVASAIAVRTTLMATQTGPIDFTLVNADNALTRLFS